jgi:acetoin utilization protein AcuB
MYVKLIMKRDLVTIRPDTHFYEARWIIQEKGMRHLPVVDESRRILGMVTNFDIRSAAPADSSMSLQDLAFTLGKLKVASFMTPVEKLATVTPDTIIEKAVQLMHERKVSCLPVLDKGQELVGMVTETDILETFADLMGLKEKATRLTVMLEDEPGKLFGALEVIKNYNVNVISVFSPTFTVEGKRQVVIRLRTQDYARIVRDLEKLGYGIESVVKWPSM